MYPGKVFAMKLFVSILMVIFVNLDDVHAKRDACKMVQTHDGAVRGLHKYTLFRNVSYCSFLGIPYAEKPIGNRRFKVCYATENYFIEFQMFRAAIKIVRNNWAMEICVYMKCVVNFRRRYPLNHGIQKF